MITGEGTSFHRPETALLLPLSCNYHRFPTTIDSSWRVSLNLGSCASESREILPNYSRRWKWNFGKFSCFPTAARSRRAEQFVGTENLVVYAIYKLFEKGRSMNSGVYDLFVNIFLEFIYLFLLFLLRMFVFFKLFFNFKKWSAEMLCKMAELNLISFFWSKIRVEWINGIVNEASSSFPLYFRDNKNTIISFNPYNGVSCSWRREKSYLPGRERSVEWNYQLIVWWFN